MASSSRWISNFSSSLLRFSGSSSVCCMAGTMNPCMAGPRNDPATGHPLHPNGGAGGGSPLALAMGSSTPCKPPASHNLAVLYLPLYFGRHSQPCGSISRSLLLRRYVHTVGRDYLYFWHGTCSQVVVPRK